MTIGAEPGGLELSPEETAKALEAGRAAIAKRFNVTPLPTGSVALNINVPGHVDLDYAVPLRSKDKMLAITDKLRRHPEFETSQYHAPDADYQIFTWKRQGQLPIDIALMYGEKGQRYRHAILAAKAKLSPEQQELIRNEKQRLLNAIFLRQARYKRYKRQIDEQLGVGAARVSSEPLAKAADEADVERIKHVLSLPTGFAHRTTNLEGILRSGRQLTAQEAAKKGLLKSIENVKGFRGRAEYNPDEHLEALRKELFGTEGGVLPAGQDYGQYGVVRLSRSKRPSPYFNMVPGEVLSSRNTSMRTGIYLVPQNELKAWRSKYPGLRFVANEELPSELVLPNRSVSHLPVRAARQLMNLATLQPTSLVG